MKGKKSMFALMLFAILVMLNASVVLISVQGVEEVPVVKIPRAVVATGGYLVRGTLFSDVVEFVESKIVMVMEDEMNTAVVDWAFTDSEGNKFEITFLMPINMTPMGPLPSGGIMADVPHHGETGIGTSAFPELLAHQAVWGMFNVSVNGVFAYMGPGHVMVLSQGGRSDETNEFLSVIEPEDEEVHAVIFPAMEGMPPVPDMGNLTEGFVHMNWDIDEQIWFGSIDINIERDLSTALADLNNTQAELSNVQADLESERATATPRLLTGTGIGIAVGAVVAGLAVYIATRRRT